MDYLTERAKDLISETVIKMAVTINIDNKSIHGLLIEVMGDYAKQKDIFGSLAQPNENANTWWKKMPENSPLRII